MTLGQAIVATAFGKKLCLTVIVVKKDDLPLFGLDRMLKFNLALPPHQRFCTVSQRYYLVNELTKKFREVFFREIRPDERSQRGCAC